MTGYKTEPRGKQRDVIEKGWMKPVRAFLCRPGTGKSKLSIDTAAKQYRAGMIEAFLIIAPDGVQSQWVLEAIPTHMPDDVSWIGGYYSSTGTRIRAHKALEDKLTCKGTSLKVLAISYEGLSTPRGKKLAERLVTMYKTLVVADESHRVSNMKATGHRAVKRVMVHAATKRIATGTLLRQNPFAAYGQFELMGTSLLGFGSMAAFKSMYAKMLDKDNGLVKHIQQQFKLKTGKLINPQIIAKDANDRPIYKNLPDLRRRLKTMSDFLTLEDVNGTEPVVNVSTRYVEMTNTQQGIYNDLLELGVAEFGDKNDKVLIADGSLALATRLAQIVGGFVPNEDEPEAQAIDGPNHRLQALLELCEENAPDKLMIWARFKPELGAIAQALTLSYGAGSVAEYHGDVSAADKRENKARFRDDPNCLFFVAQQQAGGTGLDGLQGAAHQMVFYSNVYAYLDREQCIARLARTNGADTVNVVDLMCQDTIDEDIVKCMQSAQDVTDQVLLNRLKKAV